MPTWLSILLVVLCVVAASLIASFVRTRHTQIKLRKFFAGRDPARSFESCLAAFREIEEQRVRLAYRWVQELVNYPAAPIQPDDDLWADLRVDEGDASDLFESSHDWRGDDERDKDIQSIPSPSSVRQLMAEVLAFRYEGFAEMIPKERG